MVRTASTSARVSRTRRLLTAAAATALAATSVGAIAPVASAQGDLTISVGTGRATEAGNVYLPGDVTVGVGDSITFVIDSDIPHTVTVGEGPADVPPFAWPRSGFDDAVAGPPPTDLGTASIDGDGFVHTGVLFGIGSSATVEFTAPGTVPIICTIHPGMGMSVTVVEDGPTTTQEEADAAGEETRQLITNAFAPMRERRASDATSTEAADGTTTWSMFADASTPDTPLPGGGVGYAELLEFLPDTIEISAGDAVSWTASRVHTVTFVPAGTSLRDPFPDAAVAFAPVGDGVYTGTETLNSGFFNTPGPGGLVTEYSVTFPEAGVYDYFCSIHAELGHSGTIIVS